MGNVGGDQFPSLWTTQWLRGASGILVIAPALVLWAPDNIRRWKGEHGSSRDKWLSGSAFLAAAAVGFVVFSPLLALPMNRGALGIIAVSPLLWAALHGSQRDTAACMLILSAFAVWGAWPGGGPFGSSPDDSFLISTIFLISASVLGLMLSADITQRQRVKAKLRLQEHNLRTLLS